MYVTSPPARGTRRQAHDAEDPTQPNPSGISRLSARTRDKLANSEKGQAHHAGDMSSTERASEHAVPDQNRSDAGSIDRGCRPADRATVFLSGLTPPARRAGLGLAS